MNNTNHYRRAGVNIDAGTELVSRIRPFAQEGANALTNKGAELLGGLGGFAAALRLPPRLKNPVLLAATDGVGTKVALLAANDRLETAGIDVVAMCVNDLICGGAQPLFFLDYYACGKLSPSAAARVVAGIAQGCRECDCALVGGETAEMPGVYDADKFDVAGFAVGVAEESALIRPQNITVGDVIIALASDGAHSNGYSLIRRIIAKSPPPPWVLAELLRPTRIYCRAIAALREKCQVQGLAHITGGGLTENLPRALPPNTAAHIDDSRPRPPLFDWLQEAGEVGDDEMRRVFNCGIGMAAIVPAQEADIALHHLQQSGETAWRLGKIIAAEGTPRVIF